LSKKDLPTTLVIVLIGFLKMKNNHKPIIFYDGECNICNHFVQLILSNRVDDNFFFSSLQSQTAKEHNIPRDIDSIIYFENNRAYIYSSAVIKSLDHLKFSYKILKIIWLTPKPIRDLGYRLFAKNRHRFLKSSCRILTEEEHTFFLP
jgi:predicted DCC family thiol-disulfide oxidoreductase YuxK